MARLWSTLLRSVMIFAQVRSFLRLKWASLLLKLNKKQFFHGYKDNLTSVTVWTHQPISTYSVSKQTDLRFSRRPSIKVDFVLIGWNRNRFYPTRMKSNWLQLNRYKFLESKYFINTLTRLLVGWGHRQYV